MFPAWLAAVLVTAGFVIVWRRSDLDVRVRLSRGDRARSLSWPAAMLVGAAAVLVVFLDSPALAVLGLACLGVVAAVAGGHVSSRRILEAVDPAVLAGCSGSPLGWALWLARGLGLSGCSSRPTVV